MRHLSPQRLVPLALILAWPIAAAPADDDLFLPAYRPYARVAAPPAAAATPAAPARSITIPLPRLAWPKLGGRSRSVLPPVEAPPVAAGPGPTVASTLSVVADPPDYVPVASRGVISRLRQGDPEVPPGLPRGAEPRAMIPPEPLEPSPALAAASDRGLDSRHPGDPAPSGRPSTDGAARTSLAVRPAAPRRISSFAPVRPRDIEEPALEPARSTPTPPAIPPLIARPDES